MNFVTYLETQNLSYIFNEKLKRKKTSMIHPKLISATKFRKKYLKMFYKGNLTPFDITFN